MREQVRDKGRLEHILQSIENIFQFTAGVSFDDFKSNKMMRFAVIKNLEIIGEASWKLTNELREAHSEIEWRKITGMRHVLVHGYYQIEDMFAWEIIEKDLQPLKEKIEAIYKTIE
ncbi:MAG: DUF86 domain-containing protein [Bacteroidales bacterium]|jgi:uncharacterized protein with HEPN domain|nr:DUF86 domain-containing protein [Bacteroidales bacterium]